MPYRWISILLTKIGLAVLFFAFNHLHKVPVPGVIPYLSRCAVDAEHPLNIAVLDRVDGIVPIERVGVLLGCDARAIGIQPALRDRYDLVLRECV